MEQRTNNSRDQKIRSAAGAKTLLVVACAAAVSGCGKRVEPGSPAAARRVATEYVAGLYGASDIRRAPSRFTNERTGASVEVYVRKARHLCDVGVLRHTTADPRGWVVVGAQCAPGQPLPVCKRGDTSCS